MQISRTAWILIAIAALVAVVVALFNWNWLRGPISSYISTKFGRPFVINGDLHGEFSLTPGLTADYVTLANTPLSINPLMARASMSVCGSMCSRACNLARVCVPAQSRASIGAALRRLRALLSLISPISSSRRYHPRARAASP